MNMTGHKTWPKLTSREEFRFLADLVLKHSSGDYTLVSLHDQQSGTSRFANNQIVQNVDTRRGSLRVTVAFGRHHGTAGTTDFTAGAIQDTLTRARADCSSSPVDPEYLPPVERQHICVPCSSDEKPPRPGRSIVWNIRMKRSGIAGWKILASRGCVVIGYGSGSCR